MKHKLSLFLFLIISFTLTAYLSPTHAAINDYDQIRFKTLNVTDGLSQNTVNSIIQDNDGFLWFATQDGLNKYDGYTFINYSDPALNLTDSNLNDTIITTLYLDSHGMIWIGTFTGGLSILDPKTNKIKNFLHDPNDASSLSHNEISVIFEDSSGTMWIGTNDGGLNKFDKETESFISYQHSHYYPQSLSDNKIRSIVEDHNEILWIGTGNGYLNAFNRKTNSFRVYDHRAMGSELELGSVNSLILDDNNNLWIGTEGAGLIKKIPNEDRFTLFQKDGSPFSISSNKIKTLYMDSNNRIWIGMHEGGGLNILNLENSRFYSYNSIPGAESSLSDNSIRSIFEDSSGMIWIGTFTGGINLYDIKETRFKLYQKKWWDKNSLSHNSVRSFYKTEDNIIYIATDNGLNRFNRNNNEWKHYYHNPEDDNSLPSNTIRSIYPDNKGNLWLATHGGLSKFNLRDESFTNYYNDPNNSNSLVDNVTWRVFIDSKNYIWIGTRRGLSRFDPKENTFTNFKNVPTDNSSIISDRIFSIYEDQENNIWIGSLIGGLSKFLPETESFINYRVNEPDNLDDSNVTSIVEQDKDLWFSTSKGFSLFDKRTKSFKTYTEEDDLSSNMVYGILPAKDTLWISTNKGLSQFNPESGSFINFDISDGLQSNEFNNGAFYLANDGEMFFGGISGFNSFYPDETYLSSYMPPLAITNVEVFNKKVKPSEIAGDDPSNSMEYLELSHKNNFISFEFASLDFSAPSKIEYAYRLEGFDEEWIYSGNGRYVSYSNLSPGSYVFKVRGTNGDGIWSDHEGKIQIKIIPAFWQTKWFYILIFAIFLTILGLIYRYKIISIRRQNRKLELIVKERTVELVSLNNKLMDEIHERKKAEEAIREIAYHDPLTNLPNRRLFMELGQQALNKAITKNESIAVLFLDLDKFKLINDTHGHDAGDLLLIEISKRLKNNLRESDVICRIGGDEFIIFLNHIKDRTSVISVINKLISSIKPPINLENYLKVNVSASIGCCLYKMNKKNIPSLEFLVKTADQMMYQAKSNKSLNYAIHEGK